MLRQREAITSINILAKRRRQENSLRAESGSIKFGFVALNSWDAPILLADDESWGQTKLKLPRGPRWREFHCFAAHQFSYYMTRRALRL